MSTTPLKRLKALGQSVWFDYIRRDLYQGPQLRRLIEQDGLCGMTSNPTIFEKAIVETSLYDSQIRSLAKDGKDPAAIVESLAVEDVRGAADVFRSVYNASGGDDGFVSIEVRPELARDAEGSIREARRLWKACDRPNVMVKIPATNEGIFAIRRCLSEGININITLLFSIPRYREVMGAYLAAMEERVSAGQSVKTVRSVASFFVSRVDTYVDRALDAIAEDGARSDSDRQLAEQLRGTVAIANARMAYETFEKTFAGPRYRKLQEHGAQLQRPLWASTSAKNPSYPDLYYVEALVAPNSVDTMPPETFATYRDHGDPKIRIHDDLAGAHAVFERLAELGIVEHEVSSDLEQDGTHKFSESIGKIVKAVEKKVRSIHALR